MSELRNVSLAEGRHGQVVAHRVDCPDVRRQADRGEMVFTMLEMSRPLPDDIERHTCILEEDD